jgi:hypothetical protein
MADLTPNPPVIPDPEEIKKLVEVGIAEALKPIKSKLDSAYGERDEANAKLSKIAEDAQEAEKKRLEDEGKHKELYELQVKELKEKQVMLEKKNTGLTRDLALKDILKKYEFRNSVASDMVYSNVVGTLVKTESGSWVNANGQSMQETVEAFMLNEDNAFLLKPKPSSGTGSPTAPTGTPTTPKKLSEMSQEEVLKMAAEGKLPNQQAML